MPGDPSGANSLEVEAVRSGMGLESALRLRCWSSNHVLHSPLREVDLTEAIIGRPHLPWQQKVHAQLVTAEIAYEGSICEQRN